MANFTHFLVMGHLGALTFLSLKHTHEQSEISTKPTLIKTQRTKADKTQELSKEENKAELRFTFSTNFKLLFQPCSTHNSYHQLNKLLCQVLLNFQDLKKLALNLFVWKDYFSEGESKLSSVEEVIFSYLAQRTFTRL